MNAPRDYRWNLIERLVIRPIREELLENLINENGSGTRVYTFEELRAMSRHPPEYPNGVPLETGEVERGYLYGRTRVDLAEEYGLYFRAAPGHGTGLQFTVHQAVGADWTLNHNLNRQMHANSQALDLLGASFEHLPPGAVRDVVRGLRDMLVENHGTLREARQAYLRARERGDLRLPPELEEDLPPLPAPEDS